MKASEIFHLINVSQKDIAEALGVTPQAISGWIKNDCIPANRHKQLLEIARKHHSPISEDDLNPAIVQTSIKSLKPASIISPILTPEESAKFVAIIQLAYEHHFKAWNDHKTIPSPNQMVDAFVAFAKNPPARFREVNLSKATQLNSPELDKVKLDDEPIPAF